MPKCGINTSNNLFYFRTIVFFSWLFVVLIPLAILLLSLFTDLNFAVLLFCYLLFLLFFRLFTKSSLVKTLIVNKMMNNNENKG